jgi:type IV pilus assembly protein PilE
MKKTQGFTLIEIMIVVVIVAILAAVAVPSYQDSVRKTRRADAKEALTKAAAAQERYFFTHNQYAGTMAALGLSSTSTEGHYSIVFADPDNKDSSQVQCKVGTSTYPCFRLTAVAATSGAQAGDTNCQTFVISHTGKKQAFAKGTPVRETTDQCW